MSHPLPPLFERAVGVVVGGFVHEGHMNGPGEPKNNWAGAESMGLAEPSGRAADTWEYFDRVIEAVLGLGADHVVTSLEWARISPKKGEVREDVIANYGDQLNALRVAGIHPMVRLGTGVTPWWAGEEFWLMPGSPETFVATMVEVVVALGVNAASWVSHGEWWKTAISGWLTGEAPPFRKLAVADLRLVLDNLLTAHVLLAHELHQRGVEHLSFELPNGPYEFSQALAVVLEAATRGDDICAAVESARPVDDRVAPWLAALDPFGVSGNTPAAVLPFMAKLLRGKNTPRWFTEAQRLAGELSASPVAQHLAPPVSPKFAPPLTVSLTRPQATRQGPRALPRSFGHEPWFVDQLVTTVRHGVVTSRPFSRGMPGYFAQRRAQLEEVAGPVRYTYNSLVDGYLNGSFAARTGIFGVDRARGHRGLSWMATDAAGNDAAAAFRELATAVRKSNPA